MTAPAPSPAPATATPPDQPRLSGLFGDMELLVVILLGIVSVATAYTSFQSTLYDGLTASSYSQAQNSQTEAESLYLEANQTYVQDVQTWGRLTELSVDMDSPDPVVAEAASAKFDTLQFVLVDEIFDAAITWSDEETTTTGDYVGPFESEEYFGARFGAWAEEDDRSIALFETAEEYNTFGDRLQLNTVLMAITLFLLGIAAVVKRRRIQWILIGFGMTIFTVAAVLTALVPFAWF
ncbi:hypothetical protein [Microbacterium invictum]|uniref:DUF4337 domain-containing protein n=1 Tax=Microbacterium invictum TaxID=515415 RepID=A0ABZ0VB25_9MICO|nr:hypothetical protein [Microbacterium invictum]WQB70098.1 hypothetical protein T9R20_15575 [Microbacterium invictum]